MAGFHLAQVNIARPLEPLDAPLLAEFMAQLDPVNALADAAPGFVWRLVGEGNNATSVTGFEADASVAGLIVNMSVWESLEALRDYVFSPAHLAVMRRRREWFEKMAVAYAAAWWIPVGTIPTVADAEQRVAHLRQHGPTPVAFTFAKPFAAPDGAPVQRVEETCPA